MNALDCAIGPRIRRLRLWKGLSQQTVCFEAAKVGHPISIAQMQSIEYGATQNPGIETLARVAKGLGVEPWQLLAPDAEFERLFEGRAGTEAAEEAA